MLCRFAQVACLKSRIKSIVLKGNGKVSKRHDDVMRLLVATFTGFFHKTYSWIKRIYSSVASNAIKLRD